jgi:hypothetical protein
MGASAPGCTEKHSLCRMDREVEVEMLRSV